MHGLSLKRLRHQIPFAPIILLVSCSCSFAQSPDTLFELGREAFHAGEFDRAVLLLEDVLNRDRDHVEAYYFLAQSYQRADPPDLKRARGAIRKALELSPADPQLLTVKLQLARADSSKWFSLFRAEAKADVAGALLRVDSTNALANLDLGERHLQFYLVNRSRVLISSMELLKSRYDVGALDTMGCVGASAGIGVNPAVLDLLNKGHFDVDRILLTKGAGVTNDAGLSEAFTNAERHLERALASDRQLLPAYIALTRLYIAEDRLDDLRPVLAKMQVEFPSNGTTWLYSGLLEFQAGDLRLADEYFSKAFVYLGSQDVDVFEDITKILGDEELDRYRQAPAMYRRAYWDGHDSRYLTPTNERKLEHYARLVYADLFYRAPKIEKRGWETDRGAMYVRYGAPQRDYTLGESFEVWDYADARFVFYNPFPMLNEYFLYSPKACELSSPGQNPWTNDYVIKAREMFRKVPSRSTYTPDASRVPIPHLTSVFKSAFGGADIYVSAGVPVGHKPRSGSLSLELDLGVFLVDPEYGVVSRQRKTVHVLPAEQIHSYQDMTLWSDVAHISAAPGTYELSVEMETQSKSIVAFERTSLVVPDLATPDLSISDLLLAYRIEEVVDGSAAADGQILRENMLITAAPVAAFGVRRPIYLFFEVYNLPTGAAGTATYTIEAATNLYRLLQRFAWNLSIMPDVDDPDRVLPDAIEESVRTHQNLPIRKVRKLRDMTAGIRKIDKS